MTDNLKLSLVDNSGNPKTIIASNKDGSTFNFTPTTCSTSGACSINGYTVLYSGAAYYNYYAATAETVPSTTTNTDANASLCPAGWIMPSAIVSFYSYGNLLTTVYGFGATSAARLADSPLSFTAMGYTYNSSTPTFLGDYHYLESTSGGNANTVYALWTNGNSLYADNDYFINYRYQGRSLRCVASPLVH